MNPWPIIIICLQFLLSFLIPPSQEISCFHCNYRQTSGNEGKNIQCLDPKKHHDQVERITCPADKPVCSKFRGTTSKFGIVMERGCFPRFPSGCKKFGTLDSRDMLSSSSAAAAEEERVLEGVEGVAEESAAAAGVIVFENVVGCFCDSEDECNSEPGNEMIDTKGRAGAGGGAGSNFDYGDDVSFDSTSSATSQRSKAWQDGDDDEWALALLKVPYFSVFLSTSRDYRTTLIIVLVLVHLVGLVRD